MGSRIMHAIIAYEVTKQIPTLNVNEFLLGSIAPDAINDKELTHFFSGDALKFNKKVDYDLFWSEYGNKDSDYLLGYYCHLIADEMWMNGFFSPWLKKLIEVKPEKQQEYFDDFKLLNHLLLLEFDDSISAINDLNLDFSLPELPNIELSSLKTIIRSVQDDTKTNGIGDLSVFSYDQISSYIKRVVDKSVYLINVR